MCVMFWQVKWEGSFIQRSIIAVTVMYDKREIGNIADIEAPYSLWWLGGKCPPKEVALLTGVALLESL